MSEKKIVWSTDEELFNCDSLEELIRDHDLDAGTIVFYGEASTPSPTMFIDGDDVISTAQGRAYDEFGEFAENFLDSISVDEKLRLDDFISSWIEKNADVTFYMVNNTAQHIITDDDVYKAHN